MFSFEFGTMRVDEVDGEHMLEGVLGRQESKIFMEVSNGSSGTEQVPKSC